MESGSVPVAAVRVMPEVWPEVEMPEVWPASQFSQPVGSDWGPEQSAVSGRT